MLAKGELPVVNGCIGLVGGFLCCCSSKLYDSRGLPPGSFIFGRNGLKTGSPHRKTGNHEDARDALVPQKAGKEHKEISRKVARNAETQRKEGVT